MLWLVLRGVSAWINTVVLPVLTYLLSHSLLTIKILKKKVCKKLLQPQTSNVGSLPSRDLGLLVLATLLCVFPNVTSSLRFDEIVAG